jgi:hypothetical protein
LWGGVWPNALDVSRDVYTYLMRREFSHLMMADENVMDEWAKKK